MLEPRDGPDTSVATLLGHEAGNTRVTIAHALKKVRKEVEKAKV